MTTFTIDTDNNITAHATSEAAAATTTTPFDSFSSPQEFAELAESWPAQRLLAIWSSLPGVQPIRKFQDRKTAVARIWERIQGLAAPVPAQPTPSAQPKAARHAKGGAQSAKAAPAKGKAAHKTTAAKKGKRAKKSAPAPETTAPRPGSKTAQVVAMLRRKNGATLSEDHAEHGLAEAYRPRLHGGRDEEGRPPGGIFQARGRGAHVSNQFLELGPDPYLLCPPGAQPAVAGFFFGRVFRIVAPQRPPVAPWCIFGHRAPRRRHLSAALRVQFPLVTHFCR